MANQHVTTDVPCSISQLVDSTDAVRNMIDSILNLPTNPPSLYLDLEGVELSRTGTISILQIFASPLNIVYLVDIHTLKGNAFSTPGTHSSSLQDILQSSSYPKVFFDVRNDSDALHHHFSIKLAGVQDLQVMEYATRPGRKGKFVCGLKKCLETSAIMSPAERILFQDVKNRGLQLFAPERGGSYEIFNQRPLPQDMIEYCVHDVQYLPRLWTRYKSLIGADMASKVQRATNDRIKSSQSLSYQPHGRHQAIAPSL